MSKERLVVIGGDAAGMSAASQARRRRPDLEVVAFERSPHTSYSACSIPYYVGGLIDEADRLVARTPQAFRERYDIVARPGLQQRKVSELGWACETATIESHTRVPFMPGAGKIAVKLLVERGSGRLLGGQIVGAQGSARRIDVIAVALHAGMTADELIDLDLGYAPPYSPVWDPVAIAARQVSKRV